MVGSIDDNGSSSFGIVEDQFMRAGGEGTIIRRLMGLEEGGLWIEEEGVFLWLKF